MSITWRPVRNTERSAVARHGNVWQTVRKDLFRGAPSWLITSPDLVDLRWIGEDQVLHAE